MESTARSMLLLFLCANVLPLLQSGAMSAGPPPGGNWVVAQDLMMSDLAITLDGNLTVKAGATLELTNVSLDFFNLTDNNAGITVENGGTLVMNGCSANWLNNFNPYFDVYGDIVLNETLIDNPDFIGLQFVGGTQVITGCQFQNGQSNSAAVISCQDSKTDISNCTFEFYYGTGIWAKDAQLNITNCSFNIYENIFISATSSTVSVDDCFFPSTHNTMAVFDSSIVTVSGCDFGERRPGDFLAGALVHPSVKLSVQNCGFNFSHYGIMADASAEQNQGMSGIGIYITNPQESLIYDDYFETFEYGVYATSAGTILVSGCQFESSSASGWGMGCGGFGEDDCLVQNNTFVYGNSIWTLGGARIKNNNITFTGDSYSSIDCTGNVEVSGNTLFTENKGASAIRLSSGVAEITDNSISGFGCGVCDYYMTGKLTMNNNIITNCTTGVAGYPEMDIENNSFSGTGTAISAGEDSSNNDQPFRAVQNHISDSDTGIGVHRMLSFRISDNSIAANNFGINVWGSDAMCNAVIGGNTISANRTGILLTNMYADNASSLISGNAVSGCERGMELDSSAIPLRGNWFTNISEWGVYVLDSPVDPGGAIAGFVPSSPDAFRAGRLWTVNFDAQYNSAPPGDPEHWVSSGGSTLNVQNGLGVTVLEGSGDSHKTFALEQYRITADGERIDLNPYTVTAMSPGFGAGRVRATVNSTGTISVRLFRGPDLLPVELNISEEEPIEGHLLFICATVENNDIFNPNLVPADNTTLELSLDGQPLSSLLFEVFPDGGTYSISAAWMATPGWHNVSITARPSPGVTDVLPDNNVMTKPFFVIPLPACRILSEGTTFNTWEVVNFSIETENNETIAGYSYDFGDGSSTGWLSSPNTSHAYIAAGNYTVRARVASSRGAVNESESIVLHITMGPSALTLEATPNPSPSNHPMLFTALLDSRAGNVSLAIWQFGDGGYSYNTGQLLTEHSYAAPGLYNATLTLDLECGGNLFVWLKVQVLDSPPVTVVKVTPESGDATDNFLFESLSTDSDGRIVAFRWDFGDGNTSSSPMPVHSYATHGTYKVSLVVEDDSGNWSDPDTFIVRVSNIPPTVVIRADRSVTTVGQAIAFDGSGTTDIDDPPAALTYHWDFGDGTGADGTTARKSFAAAGTYNVSLSVDDRAGGVTVKNITVVIQAKASPGPTWAWSAAAYAIAVISVAVAFFVGWRMTRRKYKRPVVRKRRLRPVLRERHSL